MIKRLLLAVAMLAASPVAAQSITISAPPTVNANGQPRAVTDVFVRNSDGSIASNTSGLSATTIVSPALTGGLVAKASAGYLYGVNVTTGATAGYVLVTNTATIPADGAIVPSKCVALAANTSLDLGWRASPLYSATGFSISFSSTGCFTKTASATAFISVDVR